MDYHHNAFGPDYAQLNTLNQTLIHDAFQQIHVLATQCPQANRYHLLTFPKPRINIYTIENLGVFAIKFSEKKEINH